MIVYLQNLTSCWGSFSDRIFVAHSVPSQRPMCTFSYSNFLVLQQCGEEPWSKISCKLDCHLEEMGNGSGIIFRGESSAAFWAEKNNCILMPNNIEKTVIIFKLSTGFNYFTKINKVLQYLRFCRSCVFQKAANLNSLKLKSSQ